jgi:cellobiose-specific phosphotransferase system component IIB
MRSGTVGYGRYGSAGPILCMIDQVGMACSDLCVAKGERRVFSVHSERRCHFGASIGLFVTKMRSGTVGYGRYGSAGPILCMIDRVGMACSDLCVAKGERRVFSVHSERRCHFGASIGLFVTKMRSGTVGYGRYGSAGPILCMIDQVGMACSDLCVAKGERRVFSVHSERRCHFGASIGLFVTKMRSDTVGYGRYGSAGPILWMLDRVGMACSDLCVAKGERRVFSVHSERRCHFGASIGLFVTKMRSGTVGYGRYGSAGPILWMLDRVGMACSDLCVAKGERRVFSVHSERRCHFGASIGLFVTKMRSDTVGYGRYGSAGPILWMLDRVGMACSDLCVAKGERRVFSMHSERRCHFGASISLFVTKMRSVTVGYGRYGSAGPILCMIDRVGMACSDLWVPHEGSSRYTHPFL